VDFLGKPVKKTTKKLAPNLIQFVMPVIIKDFFSFKVSKDSQVMNLQIVKYSKLLVKLNKNLADELNQPTRFPCKVFHKLF